MSFAAGGLAIINPNRYNQEKKSDAENRQAKREILISHRGTSGQNKDIWGIEFEAILYVPIWAWARKHGKEAANYPHTPRFSCETGSNKKVEEETGVDSIVIKTV